MNTLQIHFTTMAKRFLINTLIILLFGVNLSTAYAQVCGSDTNLIAGRWTMIALPCAPTSNTVEDVFGDDLGVANYSTRWIVYERNESTDTYLVLSLSSTLNQGESYWILSLDNATVGVTGTATPLTTGNVNCPSAAGCFEVTLTPPDINTATRQNMVGHPFPFDVDWADLVVEVDGIPHTPSAAEMAGFVSKTINKYNGNSYDPFDDVTPAMEGVLNIYDGIWVETLGGSAGMTAKLLIADPNQPSIAQDDNYSFLANADQNVAAGSGLFVDNGSGVDTLGTPAATLTSFGGDSLGGAVTDNAAGASIALAGGTLTVNADGSWSLTGQPFTSGTFTFDYQLTNTAGTSDATVTLMITALASCNDDSYTATGNVGIDSTNGTNQSVLFNDMGMPLTVTAFDDTSNNSTTVNVNVQANGEFTYNPPVGFTGADSFTYTANTTLTCTVNITVSDRIWFIDNSGANGDGRLGSPFNSIANFNGTANDIAGDTISLDTGSGNYAGPLTLLTNQKLIGEGASDTIANIAGITLAALSDALPTTGGTRPVIAHSTNNLTLGQGNTVRGLDLSNTGGTGLIGNNFGNLALSEVSINNTAGISVNLNTGTPTASFTQISASNGTSGIVLNNTTGSFTVTGDGSTATQGGNGTGGTIQNTSGTAISVTNVSSLNLKNMTINTPALHGMDISELGGTSRFDNITVNNVNNASNHGIRLRNFVTQNLNFIIDNSRFTESDTGGTMVLVQFHGSVGATTITVEDSRFDALDPVAFQLDGYDATAPLTSGTLNHNFLRNTLQDADTDGVGTSNHSCGGALACVFDISNNIYDDLAKIGNANSGLLNTGYGSGAIGGGSDMTLNISGNQLSATNASSIDHRRGINIINEGTGSDVGDMDVTIDNNTADDIGNREALYISNRAEGGDVLNMDISITRNRFGTADIAGTTANNVGGTRDAIFIENRAGNMNVIFGGSAPNANTVNSDNDDSDAIIETESDGDNGSTPTVNMTMTHNAFASTGTSRVQFDMLSDATGMCVDVRNNTATNSATEWEFDGNSHSTGIKVEGSGTGNVTQAQLQGAPHNNTGDFDLTVGPVTNNNNTNCPVPVL